MPNRPRQTSLPGFGPEDEHPPPGNENLPEDNTRTSTLSQRKWSNNMVPSLIPHPSSLIPHPLSLHSIPQPPPCPAKPSG